ncbi:Uma2 family endonuclease [Synechocystis salina]|uniref:Uma2 family endonuclease n=1 Tax=Synechocystis salina LEGE 00031 TaxID=1828736 RepID=A0ABR9VRX1_9SYNC|nr:Uma2 family endonuclease [Synechocystis salina]MBE9241012.1 Uma2 family endonuclease [Synechocystis salina LEGE 00041]MBE9254082.1 Uma2 family endonuclease [Synechocystis salina LEGE 00031]
MTALINRGLTYCQQLINQIRPAMGDLEQIVIMADVSWQDYNALLSLWGDNAPVLFKYLGATLQIMSPSYRHEFYKENLGILLEAYLQEKGIRFYSLGSTTFKSESMQRGIEPDKSYCLNQRKNIPDLAIEVVLTSGGIDSLKIYQVLPVPEVWFWQNNQLHVYCLTNQQYEKVAQSDLLPDLDLALLANYVAWEEPFDAVLAFREQIRGDRRQTK